MSNSSAKQIICNLYGLLMEANINKPDVEVLTDLNMMKNDFVEYQLAKFKQSRTKYNAVVQRNKFSEIQLQLNRLREVGYEKILALFTPQEKLQYQSCYNKFKELTDADEKSILQDTELLLFIKKIKEKIEDNDDASIS